MNLLDYEGDITYGCLSTCNVGVKKAIGYAPEIPYGYYYLTVGEHLEAIARAYEIKDWRGKGQVYLICLPKR